MFKALFIRLHLTTTQHEKRVMTHHLKTPRKIFTYFKYMLAYCNKTFSVDMQRHILLTPNLFHTVSIESKRILMDINDRLLSYISVSGTPRNAHQLM
jgi:hypothetical protein